MLTTLSDRRVLERDEIVDINGRLERANSPNNL